MSTIQTCSTAPPCMHLPPKWQAAPCMLTKPQSGTVLVRTMLTSSHTFELPFALIVFTSVILKDLVVVLEDLLQVAIFVACM